MEGKQRCLLCEESKKSVGMSLTLTARLGRPDKANWRSLAPFGRKGLVCTLVFASWRRHQNGTAQRVREPPFEISSMDFNLPSDGARNVRR